MILAEINYNSLSYQNRNSEIVKLYALKGMVIPEYQEDNLDNMNNIKIVFTYPN